MLMPAVRIWLGRGASFLKRETISCIEQKERCIKFYKIHFNEN